MYRLTPALVALLIATSAYGAQPDDQALKQLSIEELMNIDVELTARRPEPIVSIPAAVSVITNEDIRRSGVTTIADAIGLAEHVHVARFNNGSWSISPRGFNAVTANKLLVMVDGRTVYSPLFSGVFWNAVDYTLQDIDRIEVVRGPGATLWGANAVNGVINIVTRDARATRGTFIEATTGTEDPAVVDVRYGRGSDDAAFRVYGRFAARDSQRLSTGLTAADRRVRGQVGFRMDRGGDGGNLTIKADLFADSTRMPDRPPAEFVTGALQARWTKSLSPRSNVQIQSYLNHEDRDVPLQLTHSLTTFDVDAQQTIALARHGVVWGGGVRVNHDSTDGTPVISFDPRARTYPVINLFAQDEVTLLPERAFVTAGLKLEQNAFSGVEWQPGVRGRLVLPARQLIWGSLARAVRRPTRFEDDLRIGAPAFVILSGSPEFKPERLIASEFGYRVQPARVVSADVTVFSHQFDRLRSVEAPVGGATVAVIGNTQNGSAVGVEATVNLQPFPSWRTRVAYTGQRVRLTRDAGSRHAAVAGAEANDPPHQFWLRTSVDLPRNVVADARLRRVAALPAPAVPGYTELSARVAWRTNSRIELAVTGEDLLHGDHAEFNPTARGFEQFERSLRATITVWPR